jgi:hypothetical protein
VTAEIHRDLGTITLSNNTAAPISFTSYTISSAYGAIGVDDLIPVSGHYDSTGDGSVDNNNPWQITSPPGSHTLFREATTGDAGAIGAGADVILSAGDGWIPSYVEDVFVSLLLNDGSVLNATVSYTGNGEEPFDRGDINSDGDINISDWNVLLAGAYTSLAGLSPAESYAHGDLDGDRDADFADFRLFKSDFDQANGVGAFEAMVRDVPEPAAVSLIVVTAVAASSAQRRRATLCFDRSTLTLSPISREGE